MNTCNQILHIRLVISHELIYLILCVWMFWLYVHLCTTYVPSVQAGQGVGSHAAGTTAGCELGIEPRSSRRAVSFLNYSTISPDSE